MLLTTGNFHNRCLCHETESMFVSSDTGNMIPAIVCTVSFKDDEWNNIFGRSYDDETLQALKIF